LRATLITLCFVLADDLHINILKFVAAHGTAVAYAENFHGGVHSVAYGGYVYLVCTVCDVTI